MSKHTPGPWILKDGVIHAPSRVVATVAVNLVNRNNGVTKVVHDDADLVNARLIAAAPELLEALRVIAAADNSALDLAYCKGIARAAIAKATGEKP